MDTKPSNKWINISFAVILALTIVGIIFSTYSYHTTQQHALKLGKSQLAKINTYAVKVLDLSIETYAISLEDFVSDSFHGKEDTLNFASEARVYQILSKANHVLEGIYLIDPKGNLLDGRTYTDGKLRNTKTIPSTIFKDTSFQKALKGNIQQNGREYLANHSSYINLYKTVTDEKGHIKALAIVPVNLERLYQVQIEPKNDRLSGYSMVKNRAMEVIMHPAKEQIGLSIVSGRKEQYPGLDYSDLERIEQEQLTHESGTNRYYSYWWNEKKLEKVLKIAAYQWVRIGDAEWVVATNADFNEQNEMILQESLIILGLLLILLAVIILIVFSFRTYNRRNKAYNENQRLLQSQKLLLEKHTLEKSLMQESKLEAIGLLTTSIVHDMNNFLTPVIGNIQLLMDERKDDATLVADLKEVYDAAEKGQQLSKNVLRFSKDNQSAKRLIDIEELVVETSEIMNLLIPKSVSLALKHTPAGMSVFDKDDLQVILYNLITNAYQAAEKAAHIFVSVGLADKEQRKTFRMHSAVYRKKEFAVIQVRDNGPGIAKEIEDKIFTPFFTTKTSDGGTGLGLFIVSSIVKKNDWLLELESSDAGTIFMIGIPLMDDDEKKASKE